MRNSAANKQGDETVRIDSIIQDADSTTEFKVLIDESFFSLVYDRGRYVAEVLVSPDLHPGEQEAAMTEVLRRAREFGLCCFASHPHSNGWISLQFYKVEDTIDSFN